MADKKAQEVQDDFVKCFGPEDGLIVQNVIAQVVNLQVRWQTFLYLFCGPQERIDVLNRVSTTTARMLSNLLWSDCLMCIRRMNDPEKSQKFLNLSLAQLVRIAGTKQVELKGDLDDVKNACKSSCVFTDKYIAHSNLDHSLGTDFTKVNRDQTTQAIKAIVSFVQKFHLKVLDEQLILELRMSDGGERKLLLRLHQGDLAANAALDALCGPESTWDPFLSGRPDVPAWIFGGQYAKGLLDEW